MELTVQFMTRNDCFQAGEKIVPSGILVHSTAAPGLMAADWFDRWNKSYAAGEIALPVCVHAFVDDSGVWQYLPWDHRGWHAGGAANDTHIGFEICEPGGFEYVNGDQMVWYNAEQQEPYFRKAWANSVELCVYLCRMFGLNESDIISHNEGAALGIASSHTDVMHWFPRHGENMDTFRAAVKAALEGQEESMTQAQFDEWIDGWMAQNNPIYKTIEEVPSYWREETKALVSAGAILGDGTYPLGIRRETLKAAIITKRYTDSKVP